ncbi:MAG: arsenate reductase ArsC [Clostridium sp.]
MKKILFICTENSCRSQIAEAIIKDKWSDRFEAFSAGTKPAKEIDEYAKRKLEEMGVDINTVIPKSINTFLDYEFDFVITLCEKAKKECITFKNNPISTHWDLEDPTYYSGSYEEKASKYIKMIKELDYRINLLMSLNLEKMDRKDVVKKLSEFI